MCGDGLSPDVIAQFNRLKIPIGDAFKAQTNTVPITHIRVVAPNHTELEIPLKLKGKSLEGAYIPRKELDNFFLNQVREHTDITILENTAVRDITVIESGVQLATKSEAIAAQLLIGADGAQSMVARKLAGHELNHQHHGAGLRQYWEGIKLMEPYGTLDLCFPASIQPGYFWIFPLAGNRYNVGVWMISEHLKSKNLNLRAEFERLIAEDPQLAPKFKNAKPLESVKGFGLPLGTQSRPLSGNRFLLVGDAAGLIDPFTGEGIGNAIRSGRIAAEVAVEALASNDFSASALSDYDGRIHTAMKKEFKIAKWVTRLQQRPRMLNWLIGKLANNSSGKKWLANAIEGEPMGSSWINPMFYLRGFFGK